MALKKWNRKECEDRYIQGAAISLEALAKLSKVGSSTLKRWSSAGDWPRLRREYQDGLAVNGRAKASEKITEDVAELLSGLSQQHLEAYQIIRQIAMAKARRVLEVLSKDLTLAQIHQEIESDASLSDEIREKAMKQLDSGEINTLCRTIDLCVRGERLVAGLEYENINAAIAACEKVGFEVKMPAGTSLMTFEQVKESIQEQQKQQS